MTITVEVEDRLRSQVVKQMNKLINVLQATDLYRRARRAARTGAGARALPAGVAHHGAQGSRNLPRARGRFLDRRLRHRSHRRPGKLDEFIEVMRSYGEIDV